MNNAEGSTRTDKGDRQTNINYGKAIAEKLVKAIEVDERITSSRSLSSRAIRDHLPEICQTVVEAVFLDNKEIEANLSLSIYGCGNRGVEHGYVRSAQEFSPEELVREFFLLKQILINELKSKLLANPETVVDKMSQIDLIINRIMENSFQSYARVRKSQLEDLRQQVFLTKQELTRLVADRQESLSYLIHEIKNPLTSIIGYSDLFLRQQQNESSSITDLKHIKQVLHQSRKILRLVNDTSEIFAHNQNNFPLKIQEINVCYLLEDIVLGVKSSVDAKGLKLIHSCTPKQSIVNCDSLRLQQIITNLLINAIRYTEKGKIELTCRILNSEMLEIRVIDTGIGISPTEQKHIFEPYFRGTNSWKNSSDGLGLGLAIVARLVIAMQGNIEINSQANVGSEFIVTIPILT